MNLVLIERKGEGFAHRAYNQKRSCVQSVTLNMCLSGELLEEFREDPKGFVASIEQ